MQPKLKQNDYKIIEEYKRIYNNEILRFTSFENEFYKREIFMKEDEYTFEVTEALSAIYNRLIEPALDNFNTAIELIDGLKGCKNSNEVLRIIEEIKADWGEYGNK